MKMLLTKEELISQISTLVEKNPHNVKTKVNQLLHRAMNHAQQQKDNGNTISAHELKEQVKIGFAFLNSGVLDNETNS